MKIQMKQIAQIKPTVQIKDCELLDHPSGCQVLTGIVLDYPDEHQGFPGAVINGRWVRTSAVVNVEGDTVETLRTIYNVQNWIE